MIKISFREIKPTKTILLNLKKKLKFALKGENFLEFKREQLIQQIRTTWNDYKLLRNDFIEIFRKCMIILNQTYKEMGKRDFILISNISKIQYKPIMELKFLKKSGMTVPQFRSKFIKEDKLPAYSFEYTSHFIDDLFAHLTDFFNYLTQLAEKEDILLKLTTSFNRINRRLNGLRNIIIPDLQENIKNIKIKLEEIERENFVRLKKTKYLIEKKEFINL